MLWITTTKINCPSCLSIKSLFSYLSKTSFRDELISENLLSYSRMYDNISSECNKKQGLSEEQKKMFPAISKLLITLREQLISYPNEYFHGRGIVLTIGSHQLELTKVNLKMMEFSGTRLNVQIWYSSTQIKDDIVINLFDVAPKLNISICCFDKAQCRNRKEVWQLNGSHVYKPRVDNIQYKPFPYKPAAILSATFAEVLFLDSDSYIVRDPETLFVSDPMYLKFGALFYPDAYKSRQHPSLWKLFNTSCGEHEYELDSAAILVDKKRVWKGLYMTKLMNDNHELFYKYVTDGDKDTFRFGFRYLNVKYYIVMIPCSTGTFNGTHFCGWTLCKTDSLAQHIYINHAHLFKYYPIDYTPFNLAYTRIGLGDPYNNSFFYIHCKCYLSAPIASCFHIVKKPNPRIIDDNCYIGGIPSEEIEDREYMMHDTLLCNKTRINRIFITKTKNVMPHFVENLLKYIK